MRRPQATAKESEKARDLFFYLVCLAGLFGVHRPIPLSFTSLLPRLSPLGRGSSPTVTNDDINGDGITVSDSLERHPLHLMRSPVFPSLTSLTTITALTALFLTAPAVRAQNLVTNGGFETGNLTGFVRSGTGTATDVGAIRNSGSFGAFFGSGNGTEGIITQTLATTPGQQYTFSFFVRNVGVGGDRFRASFNGANVLLIQPSSAEFAFTPFSFDVTATSATTDIQFGGFDGPNYFALDDISVVAVTAAPEPGSIALLLTAGIPIVGIVRRRKRQ